MPDSRTSGFCNTIRYRGNNRVNSIFTCHLGGEFNSGCALGKDADRVK